MRNRVILFLESNRAVTFSRKIVHSYLTPQFIWQLVIRDYNLPSKERNKYFYKLTYFFNKIFWFWPTLQDTAFWRDVGVGNPSIITITNKISVLKSCDVIYSLKDGRVASTGTYDYLSKNCQYFQNLSNLS